MDYGTGTELDVAQHAIGPDPDAVAKAMVGGMNFTWCGQSCGSTSRVFLHDSIHDAVLARVVEHIRAFRPGLPESWDTTMGALASKAQYDRTMHYIEAGKAEQQPALDELFLEFALLRERIAHHADLPDYRAYAWKDRHRREYDVADAKAMHAAVEAEIVTRLRAHYARRRERMGVDTLRPWDLNADSSGADPLRPFETVAELESGLKRMFEALDPELGEAYGLLLDGWMDLEPRPNKVPGLGYQSYFPVSRRPYVYWSAVGTDGDLLTMRHEAGHAFHSVLTERSWPLLAHRSVRAEMNELAAESMELLTLPLLDDAKAGFYGAEDADRSRTKLLERVALLLVRACQVDAIQHWIYERPASELSAEAIDAAWLDLEARFDVGVDWSGLERERAKGWQIIHLFHFPFYYLEYAIAYLGALQLWERMDEDAADALAGYKRALALGGTRPMDQLYAAAGIEFRFDRELIARLGARWEAKLLEAWDSAGSGGRPG